MPDVTFTSLDPAHDALAVRGWLLDYLEPHLAHWLTLVGRDPAQARAHIEAHGLVDRDWEELIEAHANAASLVVMARRGPKPVGVCFAETRHDRYLQCTLGTVSWLYVAPEARGTALGTRLVAHATDWMQARGLPAAEIFVSEFNAPALGTYERAGFTRADARLFWRAPANGTP